MDITSLSVFENRCWVNGQWISAQETLEVKIWDEYLMFAYLFGMADKVSKQLKNLYPEYIEQELERNNLDLNTLVLINSIFY